MEKFNSLQKRLENCKKEIRLLTELSGIRENNGINNDNNHQQLQLTNQKTLRNRELKSRLLFEDGTFRCHLYCDQCSHVKLNGQRCKNRVCFGTPVCWVHSIQLYGIKIKNSTVPGFEKGLFATRPIPSGVWICPLIGEQLTDQCTKLRYPSYGPYLIRFQENVIIDSACTRGIGSMANSKFTSNGKSQPRMQHNAVVKKRHDTNSMWLESTQDIAKGEEIFLFRRDHHELRRPYITKRAKRIDTRPC